ncbi:CsgG/HfaB family protein [Roseovarius nanhaiticus]|uniref:Curli production assembly/transport component CsgG n=1 Tax=Roseovarius nanhaiticus TaxID=573024 RepID=A0A1N7FUF4_9RHOB|nr:CsgG/HfaB family protein [Roseovarius nanhaiticus]SEK45118.1 curli production assembly/transport component CsgG [Roseovarius nanhaiticus]SIS03970.1 curli production assembly/transport component CsgG [Roseovarius nanhaiticus]
MQSIGTRFDPDSVPPLSTPATHTGLALRQLPPAKKTIDVAIYKYDDKTGQNEESDNFTRFSRAVSQGMSDVLIDVLTEVGDGQWFNVIERANIQDLLTERQLIDQTNQNYRGLQTSALQPLRFAGIIISGGVIDYDTNVITGGIGARLLGIGNNYEYRRDRISVVLRAVSVQTGEVLTSVQTEKTIYSLADQVSIFRFVAVDRLLELDAGFSVNEPTGIAVRQAVELAVYDLILEGAEENIWQFQDPAVQQALIARQQRRLDLISASAQRPQPEVTRAAMALDEGPVATPLRILADADR